MLRVGCRRVTRARTAAARFGFTRVRLSLIHLLIVLLTPAFASSAAAPFETATVVGTATIRQPYVFVPGAVNLDYTLVAAEGARFKGETRPIVAYCACANEMTAARAAVDLAALGIVGAHALKGGWDEWRARGEPIEK